MAAERPATPTTPVVAVLTDVEQLKVVGDPLRLQMIELLAEDPDRGWTAKELAERLGVNQTKLYHHLGLLEEHRFIRVGSTRVVSGITERRYHATAHGFTVDHALLTGSGSQAAMSEALDAIFRKVRHELLQAIASGAIDETGTDPKRRRMGLWATHVRLSPKSVRKVMRLVERLAEVDTDPDPDGDEHTLVVGFFPRHPKA